MPLPGQPENKLFYLASPYSHKNKMIMDYRYFLVAAAAAELYNRGFNLLEPIGSGHPIATKYDLPQGYEYWMRRDRLMIDRSDGVIVLTISGWAESTGVTDEIRYCKGLGKPVYYVNPAELLPSDILANGPYNRSADAVVKFQAEQEAVTPVAMPTQPEQPSPVNSAFQALDTAFFGNLGTP